MKSTGTGKTETKKVKKKGNKKINRMRGKGNKKRKHKKLKKGE
jgi:hypothetical protein